MRRRARHFHPSSLQERTRTCTLSSAFLSSLNRSAGRLKCNIALISLPRRHIKQNRPGLAREALFSFVVPARAAGGGGWRRAGVMKLMLRMIKHRYELHRSAHTRAAPHDFSHRKLMSPAQICSFHLAAIFFPQRKESRAACKGGAAPLLCTCVQLSGGNCHVGAERWRLDCGGVKGLASWKEEVAPEAPERRFRPDLQRRQGQRSRTSAGRR